METKTKDYKYVYDRPESLVDTPTSYCPGCGHGIVHKLLAEILDEFEVREKAVIIAPVGCSVLIYNYMNVDGCEAAHGRAPAVATGIKRVNPDSVVISYQGDGDLLAIGMAETIHAANRGENFTTIFINNAIYGMTGGQMAPTTMVNQVTATTPNGRDPNDVGYPIRACELINTLERPVFIERCSIYDFKNTLKTKKAIKKGIKNQIERRGYSFIEVLSTCPTNWGMKPQESADWVRDVMVPYYPLGNLRDK